MTSRWSIGVGKPSGSWANVARNCGFIMKALMDDGPGEEIVVSGRDFGKAGERGKSATAAARR